MSITFPEQKNGPEVAPASNDFGTATQTATNQKGTSMCSTNPTGTHLCAPWCEHTLRAADPDEHGAHCVSRALGRAVGVDGAETRQHLSADVCHERDLLTARSRVRLFLDPIGGDGEPAAVAMTPANARSIARALLVAADVADGLAPVPSSWYAQRLHTTAAALADQADTAFEDGHETLSDALDSAAAKLRAQAAGGAA